MAAAPLLVVGIDEADPGPLLEWAAREALRWQGSLLIVHTWDGLIDPDLTVPSPRLRRAAEAVLAQAVEAARTLGVTVQGRLCEGFAGDALVEQSQGAALLIVGTAHRRRLSEAWHGSVSQHCARHATCPLVLVPVAA